MNLFLSLVGGMIFATIFLFFAMKFIDKFVKRDKHVCIEREIIQDKPKRKRN